MTDSVRSVGSSSVGHVTTEAASEASAPPAPAEVSSDRIDMSRDRGEVAAAAPRASRPREEVFVDAIAAAYMSSGNDGVEAFLRANPNVCDVIAREMSPDELTERLGAQLHARMTLDPFGVRSSTAAQAIYGEIRETLRGTLMEEMRREASALVERTIDGFHAADPEAVRAAIDAASPDSPLWNAAARLDLIGGDPATFPDRLEARLDDLRELRGHLRGTTWEAGAMPDIRDRVLARHGLGDRGLAHDAIRPEHREHAELAHQLHTMADMAFVGGSILATGHVVASLVEGAVSMGASAAVTSGASHLVEENFAASRLLGRY